MPFFVAFRLVNCTNTVVDALNFLLPATIYFFCFEYDYSINELSYNLSIQFCDFCIYSLLMTRSTVR